MKGKKFLLAVLLFVFVLIASACDRPEQKKAPTLKNADEIVITIDINDKLYHQVKLTDYIDKNDYDSLEYEVSSDSSKITFSQVSAEATVVVYSNGDIGTYTVNVGVKADSEVLLTFSIKTEVVDTSADPELIKEMDDVALDVPVFINGKTLMEKSIDLEDYVVVTPGTSFRAEADSASVKTEIADGMLNLEFSEIGTFDITVTVLKNDNEIFTAAFTAKLSPSYPNQIFNGGFEEGWTGWNVDNWALAVYSIHDSEFDIFGNNVGATNKYLYGFHNEAGTAEFTSSLFTAAGTGLITWKMAGNSTEDLQFKLMKYNADGEDELIETFNNWYYGKYGASGFIFREYYYEIDMDLYRDDKLYFVVADNKTEDFGFICLDDIATYYEENPDISQMYKAGFMNDPDGGELDFSDTSDQPFTDVSDVGYQLPNGDFENGYDNWFMTTDDKLAYAIYDLAVDIWSNPVNAVRNYLYGYQMESATAVFHSDLFKVGGTGLITWKMAGNSTNDLKFILMKYNADSEDEIIATFNNWYFPISEESGFIFRNYWYTIDVDLYGDEYCYFIVSDHRTGDFGFICLDEIITYYEELPAFEGAWFKAGFVNQPEDWDVLPGEQQDDENPYALLNGDFENGWDGWIADEEVKESYLVTNNPVDIWDNEVHNEGYYLCGYEGEAAKVTFESARFTMGGIGLITWKMAGNSTDDLQFILIRENPEGEDEIIAVFNNWYFPISEQSGFLFWNYFYEVDMDLYRDATFYFIVSDQKEEFFGFIALDEIKTYYEELPAFEGTWFKAGFVNQPEDWDVLPS